MEARQFQFILIVIIFSILSINGKSLKKQKEDLLLSGDLYEINLNEEKGNITNDSSQYNLGDFTANEKINLTDIITYTSKIENSTRKLTAKKNKSKKQLSKKLINISQEDVGPENIPSQTGTGKKKRIESPAQIPSITIPIYSKSDESVTKKLKLPYARNINSNYKNLPAWRQYLYNIFELPLDLSPMTVDYQHDITLEPGNLRKRGIKETIRSKSVSQVPMISELHIEKDENIQKLKETVQGFQDVMRVIGKMDMYISNVLKSYHQKLGELYDNEDTSIL